MMDKKVEHKIVKIGQSSFEFGPAKRRHKVYYEDAEDLSNKIKELKRVVEQESDALDWLSGEKE